MESYILVSSGFQILCPKALGRCETSSLPREFPTVSLLNSPGFPETHFVDHTGLELRDQPPQTPHSSGFVSFLLCVVDLFLKTLLSSKEALFVFKNRPQIHLHCNVNECSQLSVGFLSRNVKEESGISWEFFPLVTRQSWMFLLFFWPLVFNPAGLKLIMLPRLALNLQQPFCSSLSSASTTFNFTK